MRSAFITGATSATFAVVLLLLSIGMAAGGHGLDSPALVMSAPLALTNSDAAIWTAPLYWLAMGIAAGAGRGWWFWALEALHGAAAVWAVARADDNWGVLQGHHRDSGIFLALLTWIVLYAILQAILICRFRKSRAEGC